jgi:hypothetical protein
LDKFARVYAWFLLVTSGIAAVARLAGAGRMAEVTSERLRMARKRARHRLIGIVVVIASLALLPVYFGVAHNQRWMPVAAAVGALSGLEFIVNSRHPEPTPLRYQNLTFGFLFAVSTFVVYWFLFQ